MTSLFYQRFWKSIGPDIIKLVKEFFETRAFDPRLNETNICLIPKNERPRAMGEFRPISLCNVSYKIISKVLCNRLRKALPKLISETQSAFVARRLITDNILLAQENFHALRTNSTCRSKFVAIKTDMSKAYDRVEWLFLEQLLRKLGFDEKWISLLMCCVSSVSYRVLINGEAKENIIPSRGLRQGDPLSPFLFILCTEALIAQLHGAENEGRITGLKIAQGSPPVSHLLFADDSLFFCKADIQQCAEILKIINCYGAASGQQLNKEKSAILFGNRVDQNLKAELKQAIGITKEGGMGSYLGLPETICGSKQQVFAFVQDRLNARINTWSAKFLSKGGREVLIKSVAQALPTYVMSCFLLPQHITNKLRGAIARFWKFNLALLAKQLWRLLRYPDSLLSRVLKGRYFRYSNPMEVKKASSPSFGWRSMFAAKDLLLQGLRKNVRSGFHIKVWSDNWIPTVPARPAKDRGVPRDPNFYVNHLIDFDTKTWKLEALNELVDPSDIPLITSIQLSKSFKVDDYVWSYTKSGQYSVRSGYALATQGIQEVLEPSITPLKKQVWKAKISRKIKHFLWQVLSGALAANGRLAERHSGTDKSCPRCGEEESINHLLFECPPALQVWALCSIPSPPGLFPCSSLFTNIDHLLWRAKEQGVSDEQLAIFPWVLWYLWKAKNEKMFNGKDITPLDTLELASSEAMAWKMAQIVEAYEDSEVSYEDVADVEDVCLGETKCQIDASWDESDRFSGVGFVLLSAGPHFGLKCTRKFLSVLHAELAALIWAMESVLQLGLVSVHFETDCASIPKVIEEFEEWPNFSTELDTFFSLRDKFSVFTISHIPRTVNIRADRLAKGARARGELFSHVDYQVPELLAVETNLFEHE
ncbi:PREDICTED: uncharacterized protein LOC104788863 [Camelina sativa]|uniref:Uncharacterized protein LOC104788863 n=1 Tax=Camelina sativa TaxID=90675 RepID=A0ABM0ZAX4_CAMSA|nr:PREDICTED: uncharacterized protein LOC104788863 [Camelina sativa]